MKEYKDDTISQRLSDDERILTYLEGKMNEDEEKSFIDDLRSNPQLKDAAIVQAQLIKGMKDADEELINAFKNADEITIRRLSIPHKIINVHTWLAVAASVIIIIFVGFKGYDYYHVVNVGKQYAGEFIISDIVRGNEDLEVQKELKSLFTNVKNGTEIPTTIGQLEVLWAKANEDTYNDYTNYASYIGWYLAVAYLQDYQRNKAEQCINKLMILYPTGTSFGDYLFALKEAISY